MSRKKLDSLSAIHDALSMINPTSICFESTSSFIEWVLWNESNFDALTKV